MKAKKAVRYLKCPKCKGHDFHYMPIASPTGNTYRCTACGFQMKV